MDDNKIMHSSQFTFRCTGCPLDGRQSNRIVAVRDESRCLVEQRGRRSGELEQAIIGSVIRLQRRPGLPLDRHRLHKGLLQAGKVREHEKLGQHVFEERKAAAGQGANSPKRLIVHRGTTNVLDRSTEQPTGTQQHVAQNRRFVSCL